MTVTPDELRLRTPKLGDVYVTRVPAGGMYLVTDILFGASSFVSITWLDDGHQGPSALTVWPDDVLIAECPP